jgi:hypothetical protein
MRSFNYAAAVIGLIIALPASSQRRWADAREYQLSQAVSVETDPVRQIELLKVWESGYPKSDFAWERGVWFAFAYKRAGRPADAFAHAVELFHLDAKNVSGSLMIAELVPLLSTASANQVKIVKQTADNLLVHATEIGRTVTAVQDAEQASAAPQGAIDPQTERVVALIREWRVGKRLRTATDVENEIRRVAAGALDWAKGFPDQ